MVPAVRRMRQIVDTEGGVFAFEAGMDALCSRVQALVAQQGLELKYVARISSLARVGEEWGRRERGWSPSS